MRSTANASATRSPVAGPEAGDLAAVTDVPVQVSAVLGRTSLSVEDLMAVRDGTIIALDRAVGEPVDILVNGRVVARGEITLIEGRVGVTLTEIVSNRDEHR